MNERKKNNMKVTGLDTGSSTGLAAALLALEEVMQKGTPTCTDPVPMEILDQMKPLVKQLFELAEQHDVQILFAACRESTHDQENIIITYRDSVTRENSNGLRACREILTETDRFAKSSFGHFYLNSTRKDATNEGGDCNCKDCQAERAQEAKDGPSA